MSTFPDPERLQSTVLCCAVLSRFSCVRLFETLWTVTCQAPLFMGVSRQEYWSGLPHQLGTLKTHEYKKRIKHSLYELYHEVTKQQREEYQTT